MAAVRSGRLFLAAALLILLVPRSGSACTCVAGIPLCESFFNSAAVFEGEVVAVDALPRSKSAAPALASRRVRFAVGRVWRGDVPASIDVMTGSGGGDCGYNFQKGRKYLVYAAEHEGRLVTHICAPTRPLDRARADLEYLDSLSTSQAAGRIYGIVRMADRRPAARYTVVLRGADGQRQTATNASGEFEFATPHPGSYTVRVVVRDSERAFGREDVTLADARACARRDFILERER